MTTRPESYSTTSVELLHPILIKVPFQTVPKSRPRMTPGGAFTPSHDEQDDVGMLIAQHAPPAPWEFPVGLVAVFRRATLHRVDVDNLLKLVMDAATGLIYDDDYRVEFVQSMVALGSDDPGTDLLFGRLND